MASSLTDRREETLATYREEARETALKALELGKIEVSELPGLIERLAMALYKAGREMTRLEERLPEKTPPLRSAAKKSAAKQAHEEPPVGATQQETAAGPAGKPKRKITLQGRSRKDPAVPIDQSITNEYLVCLEDGLRMKMLKRHLATFYDMTPEQYRKKWRLPHDYPMVAPDYARLRARIARDGQNLTPGAAERRLNRPPRSEDEVRRDHLARQLREQAAREDKANPEPEQGRPPGKKPRRNQRRGSTIRG